MAAAGNDVVAAEGEEAAGDAEGALDGTEGAVVIPARVFHLVCEEKRSVCSLRGGIAHEGSGPMLTRMLVYRSIRRARKT